MRTRRPPSLMTVSLLALATLVSPGCSDGITFDPIDAPPAEPPPPPPPPAAPVVGDTIFAVDLANRLVVFGSESSDIVSQVTRIRGVSIFSRIIGIDFRPSDGQLYGVGNDSKVYVLDPATAIATPVSDVRFTPSISSFFDTHFGMAFDPTTEKIRLVSAEFGAIWLIDPDDGTATSGGSVRYADGDVNEGATPRISALAYLPKGTDPLPMSADLPISADLDCEDILYAIDPDLGYLIGSCDPDGIDFESIFEFNGVFTRCTAASFDGDGNLFGTVLDAAQDINSLGRFNPERGIVEWVGPVPTESPLQSVVYAGLRAVDVVAPTASDGTHTKLEASR